MSETIQEWFNRQLGEMKELNEMIEKKLTDENTKLAGKVKCTVNAINTALGHPEDKGLPDFGRSSYGYGYDSGYGRQRKAMVGYRTPKQRHRRRLY